jgi:predicted regulator of Ras-like GTPase activity (Roadblock/LC7/MglB family)
LILDARQLESTMRLMLIPLMGGGVPPEAEQLDIQGILSKPFFADDLLPSIKGALAAKVKPPSVRIAPLNETMPSSIQQVPPPPSAMPAPQAPADLRNTLSELAHETNAEATLLLFTAGGEARVMASMGSLDDARLETLTDLSTAIVRATQKTNQVWGQLDETFIHYMFESESLRFYIMVLPGDRLLILVTPITTALGTLRHNLRRAARHLSAMI